MPDIDRLPPPSGRFCETASRVLRWLASLSLLVLVSAIFVIDQWPDLAPRVLGPLALLAGAALAAAVVGSVTLHPAVVLAATVRGEKGLSGSIRIAALGSAFGLLVVGIATIRIGTGLPVLAGWMLVAAAIATLILAVKQIDAPAGPAVGVGSIFFGYGVLLIAVLMLIPAFGHREWHRVHRFHPARIAAMEMDLRALDSLQSAFFHAAASDSTGRGARYAASMSELPEWSGAEGVEIAILEATTAGWSARATHAGVERSHCVLFVGDAAPEAPAAGPDSVACAGVEAVPGDRTEIMAAAIPFGVLGALITLVGLAAVGKER